MYCEIILSFLRVAFISTIKKFYMSFSLPTYIFNVFSEILNNINLHTYLQQTQYSNIYLQRIYANIDVNQMLCRSGSQTMGHGMIGKQSGLQMTIIKII